MKLSSERKLSKLFKLIDRDELIDLTCRLVSIPSENPPGNEGRVAELLFKEFKEIGLKPKLEAVYPDRPNVIATLGSARTKGPTLILNGHMDVVPAGEGWGIDPFKGAVKGGKIFGRGSADMKGTLAAMKTALKCLVEGEVELGGNVVFQGVVDEEITGHGTETLVSSGCNGDYAIVGEPTDLLPCIAHKGTATFEVVTKGVAAHVSQPEKGVNAIMAMKKIMDAIEEHSFKLKTRSHTLLGSALVNIGLIKGGIKSNIVPNKCLIHVDRRMIPGEEPEEVIKEFQGLIRGVEDGYPDVKAEVKVMNAVGPMETNEASPLVKAAVEAVEKVLGKPIKPGGFVARCDGQFLSERGVSTIILGAGSLDQAHKVDEYVEIDQIVNAVKIYLRLALSLLR